MSGYLIGFAGRKRSGKDTASAVFVAEGFQQMAFATPLKMMVITLLRYQGVSTDTVYRMVEGDLKEVPTPFLGGRSPRHAMQTLGTEWGRQMMDDNLWVDILVNASRQYKDVVVSDVRFPNEVAAIQDEGGLVYRIERDGLEEDPHSSEALIDTLDVDATITNSAPTALDFQNQVVEMLVLRPPSNVVQ